MQRLMLKILTGKRQGEVVPVDPPGGELGRDPAATVALPERSVSGHHARLVYDQGQWWIQDLNSTNGTQLAGRAIGAKLERLAAEGTFQAGYIDFEYWLEPVPQARSSGRGGRRGDDEVSRIRPRRGAPAIGGLGQTALGPPETDVRHTRPEPTPPQPPSDDDEESDEDLTRRELTIPGPGDDGETPETQPPEPPALTLDTALPRARRRGAESPSQGSSARASSARAQEPRAPETIEARSLQAPPDAGLERARPGAAGGSSPSVARPAPASEGGRGGRSGQRTEDPPPPVSADWQRSAVPETLVSLEVPVRPAEQLHAGPVAGQPTSYSPAAAPSAPYGPPAGAPSPYGPADEDGAQAAELVAALQRELLAMRHENMALRGEISRRAHEREMLLDALEQARKAGPVPAGPGAAPQAVLSRIRESLVFMREFGDRLEAVARAQAAGDGSRARAQLLEASLRLSDLRLLLEEALPR